MTGYPNTSNRMRLSSLWNDMKQKLCMGLCLLALLAGAGRLSAQINTVQYSQFGATFNLQSQRGVAITTTSNTAIGSDGLAPSANSSTGFSADYPPTTNQFASLLSFAAVTATTNNALLSTNNPLLTGSSAFSGPVARAMQYPVGTTPNAGTNEILIVQRRIQVGVPYFGQTPSFYFGSVISAPTTDYTGITNVSPGYWAGVPWLATTNVISSVTNGSTITYTTNQTTVGNNSYYYSPNAGVVFATQPGPITITWITAAHYPIISAPHYTNQLAVAGIPSYITNVDGTVSLLYTANYLVSSSPVKTPQNMYWTEGDYTTISHPVVVQAGQISAINVIYNSTFPANVATPYPYSGGTNEMTTQTLFFQDGFIRAYNATGRVFVEILGQPNGDGTSHFLGFEIVDVAQTPTVSYVTNYLGTPLTPYSDPLLGAGLTPAPLGQVGSTYYYQSGTTLYADHATASSTDLQIYWLQTGVAGLQWPLLYDSQSIVWPSDPAQYSFYLRPLVATQQQATNTAVALDGEESPSLDYQDPLDQPRGFLTSSPSYYSWLTEFYPAHRALLRFNSGGNVRFERVFSLLSQGLVNNNILAGSVATNLSAWNPINSTLTNFAAGFNPPYVTTASATVGQRITAPPGELATNAVTGGDYWAGYINTNSNDLYNGGFADPGTSYDPLAYVDPLANGFATGNTGAIIPVNAIPGQNLLEVWWFRSDNAKAAAGFQPVYWPSVIADYTINWPTGAPAIVLANNAGSGPLDSLHAAGAIYYQNDPTQPGYNPNEEHALMLGGQVYALRDDLNLTNAANQTVVLGSNYSSAPLVLLSYKDTDGRPNMSVYSVQRENPAAGQFFDYVVQAGSLLQAPMPLPLLPPPVAGSGTGAVNFDTEPSANSGDLPNGWTSQDTNGPFSLYSGFTFQDRKNEFWVYRGPHAGLPVLAAGTYDAGTGGFDPLPTNITAVVGIGFTNYIHVSRQLASLTAGASDLPPGLAVQESSAAGLSIAGVPTSTGTYPVTLTINDTADNSQVNLSVAISVLASGNVVAQGPLVVSGTNSYSGEVETFTNRPPTLALSPAPTNSFTMQFYYKTMSGFAWPGYTNPPPVGSIVPYLLPANGAGGFVGDPTSSNTASLNIVYRPIWPEIQNGQPLPTLKVGQTLTTAINGITAVRGQDSVQVLYQQTIATNAAFEAVSQSNQPASSIASVVLYDSTVEKISPLTNGLPASVVADINQGLYFFPNLPPNLISRVWFDPNEGNLVFTGQFVSDPVNGNYVMLNVLSPDDLAAVDGLCPVSDTANYSYWTNAVANLSVQAYTYFDNSFGQYVIDPTNTVTCYAGDLVQVTNSDTAVDSYAMAATGPGQGYVSYVIANGRNPAYAGDPISICIAHVAQPLFPGALVVANSANASPFSQLITFEHTDDLAGQTGQYLYDWRIMPPVNGQPPALGSEASWTQLPQANPGPVYTLGATGVQGLTDNYISMRYGNYVTNAQGNVSINWSQWANPILAEGWISRVTQALDPIAGTTQNLYENAASTTASIIQLAGARWNGDVPLNAASLTNNGLIQLYETVLDVGKNLTINDGINYGPANQALLLAAGYLNDLYDTLGDAAWANSLNPTIGFGTDNSTYGAVATSSFCFEGEVPTLLAQNEALLRGRDDSLSPGVDLPPVYNRLYWNYTYGLDAGEVIYALNYNITDQNGDGKVNAADAQIMFPQGHGDAYGHYLTALMNYYELLMNPNFDWVPQAQTVLVLGAAVTVNYENETKFAASAAALARTGRQIFDLEWRQDYRAGTASGWNYFATNYVGQYPYIDNNGNTQHVTRYWGMDHWASRVGQGTYLNWVVANSLLPYQDSNPNDQGVQIVDRQTVSELSELPLTAAALENDMDNANAGYTPLNLPQNAIPFDINPQQVTGANPQTHFDQIYARAVQALNNAATAFNAAQNVTEDLRQQQNSLSDLQASVEQQELAYNDQLIEIYGTPYPEDMGPGGTYPQGYTGPDLIHYMYVDNVDTNTFGGLLPDPTTNNVFDLDIQNDFPTNWFDQVDNNISFIIPAGSAAYGASNYVAFNVGANGYYAKPPSWTEERNSAGSIQTAIAAVDSAQDALRQAAFNAVLDKQALDAAVLVFNTENGINNNISDLQTAQLAEQGVMTVANTIFNDYNFTLQNVEEVAHDLVATTEISVPKTTIVGLADGGDFLAPFAGLAATPLLTSEAALLASDSVYGDINSAVQLAGTLSQEVEQGFINGDEQDLGVLNAEQGLNQLELKVQGDLGVINTAEATLNGAQANVATLVSQGNRIQAERETFREHTAALVQGYFFVVSE